MKETKVEHNFPLVDPITIGDSSDDDEPIKIKPKEAETNQPYHPPQEEMTFIKPNVTEKEMSISEYAKNLQ
jgi:hypothetical protein